MKVYDMPETVLDGCAEVYFHNPYEENLRLQHGTVRPLDKNIGFCISMYAKALPTGTLQRYGLQRPADVSSVITIQGSLLAFSAISWM